MQNICPDFGICGGCEYQDMPYADELLLKERTVLSLLEQAGIAGYQYLGTEGGSPEGYRNKMEFSFGDDGPARTLTLGIRRRKSRYEVVPPDACTIVDGDFRMIAAATQAFFRQAGERFYHSRAKTGALRHLVVRKAHFTGEILVNLVTTSALAADLRAFADALTALEPDGRLVGILHTVNDSVADAVKCDRLDILYGQDFFTERILGLQFNISAFSFFQTNSAGCERLYETVRAFAGALHEQTVLDLYCGTGTIAQILAPDAKAVVGIELVEEAVEAARANARVNGLDCTFIAGDVLKLIDDISLRPDLIVLDPPREGIHPKALPKILGLRAKRVVYVSCKPSSLARDLPLFVEKGYRVEQLKIYDMFPRTRHVECVILLTRKDG